MPSGRSAACFRSGSASKTSSASLPPGKRQGRSSSTPSMRVPSAGTLPDPPPYWRSALPPPPL
eukprot:8934920-Alexandrium_andersonii.AAC.1